MFEVNIGDEVEISSFWLDGPFVPSTPDTTKPNLLISGKKKLSSPRAAHTVKGTVSDETALARVEVKARGSRYKSAKLKPNGKWSYRARGLRPGRNPLIIRAQDTSGNFSKSTRITVTGR